MDKFFYRRDKNAKEYSKSVLDQGDTLVLIKYPNDQPVYDMTGFALSPIHRVHSQNLLATGSTFFKSRLESEWLNHRAAKRAGVFPGLPNGIRYVIDLTPPEEGDDALQLTADLSCSDGIRSWHTATSRFNVAISLIGGKDEATTCKRELISLTTSPVKFGKLNQSGASELSVAVTSTIKGETSCSSYLSKLPDTISEEDGFKDEGSNVASDGKGSEKPVEDEVLDYCPIRHRAGIERLLQIIEGKDPRLDSAPKVWTLAMLAKYFDCASTVVDWIFPWIIAEPNSRFIEILPEATLKIGLALKNATLTRYAYSILVSEEALRVGSGKYFISELNRQTTDRKDITRFHRVREDLDEDILNSIQHAGRTFSGRIELAVAELLDRDMSWFHNIPEFVKILTFKEYLEKVLGLESSYKIEFKKQNINELIDGLRGYVRGRALYCLMAQLSYAQSKTAMNNRYDENWQGLSHESYDYTYNTLSDHERMLTRGFWEILHGLEWRTYGNEVFTNQIRDGFARDNKYYKTSGTIADKHGIRHVSMYSLQNRSDSLNTCITAAIRTDGFNDGKMPKDVPSSSGSAQSVVDGITDQLAHLGSDSEDHPSVNGVWAGSPKTMNPVAYSNYMDAGEKSPLFYLPIFFHQVGQRIRSVCDRMLCRGDNDWSVLCDTLLCLSEDEYKYLPLWAGGMDDGSGGVFEEEIPPAEKGPIGPGPAFHTGSTANSMMDSDFDFDARSSVFGSSATMEGMQTSLGVEDGFSDNLDRRVVYSEDEFPMEHGALPVNSYARDAHSGGGLGGLAQAQAQGEGLAESSAKISAINLTSGDTTQVQGGHSTGVSGSGLTSHIDGDDFFNVENDEEDLDFDMDGDSDSDGTLTEFD